MSTILFNSLDLPREQRKALRRIFKRIYGRKAPVLSKIENGRRYDLHPTKGYRDQGAL